MKYAVNPTPGPCPLRKEGCGTYRIRARHMHDFVGVDAMEGDPAGRPYECMILLGVKRAEEPGHDASTDA